MFHVEHSEEAAILPSRIEAFLQRSPLSLSSHQKELLVRYVRELLLWNEKVNLISRRDVDRVWEGHILHSLGPILVLEIPAGTRFLDLGTGGGLPGIPMAVAHGALQVTLLDSIQKKTHALGAIIEELQLSGVQIATGRAEDLGRSSPHNSAYDAVVSRAVAPLKDLVAWARPFLRRRQVAASVWRGRGVEFHFPYLLALKGGDLQQERARLELSFPDVAITEIELALLPSEFSGLEEKKLVVIEYP
jgi:16S rRNA (guanine527-N7)-methyltransferase